MSLRNRDSNVEKEIAIFLDKYFYPNITNDLKRAETKEEQLAGIDVHFTLPELGLIIVDEKAATHYINKDIPTFAFELSFQLHNGQEIQGWLLDKSKKTEYYLLMWIKASRTWNLASDDITEIKATLINRIKLIKYLESQSYSYEKLQRAVDKIRKKKLEGSLGNNSKTNVYFYSTSRLSEKPINVIVKRKILEELAFNSYTITKENVK